MVSHWRVAAQHLVLYLTRLLLNKSNCHTYQYYRGPYIGDQSFGRVTKEDAITPTGTSGLHVRRATHVLCERVTGWEADFLLH